jgi:hypothetical protein
MKAASILLLSCAVLAQDPPLRDPTEQDARQGPGVPAGVAPVVAPLPAIALKGLVIARGKPGVALLEMEGRLWRVRPGSIITAGRRELKVVAIKASEVRIESAGGEPIVLR